jgi:hypothetical protein
MKLIPAALRGTAFAAVTTLAIAAPAAVAHASPVAAGHAAALPAVASVVRGVRPAALPTAPPAPPQGALKPTGCSGTGTVVCELWAKPGQLVLPGETSPVPIWGFTSTSSAAATAPGPALVVNQGDTVTINVHNGLSRNLSLALPTMTGLAPETAGAPAGGVRAYTFKVGRPGTYLYEAGHTVDGARQAAMGLVGALVVLGNPAGGRPTAYGDAATSYDDDAVMVLTEVDPALNRSADPLSFDMRNYAPKYRLINGKTFPETDPVATDAGRKALLRYVNGGLTPHPMSTLGVDQLVVGQDSRPTANPEGAVTVPLAPGNTVDALVNLPAGQDGRRFMVYESGGQLNNNSQKYGQATAGVSPQQAFGGMMTYLDTNPKPVDGDHVGPVTTVVTATPDPASVLAPVTVTASFTDAQGGNATIDSAEVVVDDLGIAEGTSPIKFVSPSFGTPGDIAGATATIAPEDLQKLTQGRHTLWVRAHDAPGNWGVVNSVTVNLAITGAATTGLTVTPNPTTGLTDLAVSATGDDTAIGGTVTGAEYFLDSAGVNGAGQPLQLNQTGAKVAAETGTIAADQLAGFSEGHHSVLVHTKDSQGLWGPMATVDLVVDRTGPTLLTGAVLPATTNGTTGSPSDPTYLRINASFNDAGGVSSAIAGAEGFLDTPGANGTGLTFLSLDGSFNSATENTYGLVPLSELTRLGEGQHQILVHARDAAGNWGPLTAVTFAVDRTGPTAAALAGTQFANGVVALTANTADNLSGIAAAEWYEGADPGPGFGKPVTVTGTGATTAGLYAKIAGLRTGNHTFAVRVKDAGGNWGKAVSVTVAVNASAFIFADNFDTGNTSAWSTRAGTPQVGPSAAVSNSPALTVTGTTPGYVVDNRPTAQTMQVQFGFAADTYDTNGTVVDLFQGRTGNGVGTGNLALNVQYRRLGGVSQLRVGVATSTGMKYSGWSQLDPAAAVVQVNWSGTAGSATLSINGATSGAVSGVTTYRIESAALGVVATSGTGAVSGTAVIDNYTSNR